MSAKSKRKHQSQSLPAVPHGPAECVPATEAQELAQSRDTTAVGLKVVNGKDGLQLHLDHPDQSAGLAQLTAALGLSDPVLCNRIVLDLVGLAANGNDLSEAELNRMLAVVRGIDPTDTVEALLAVQMAAVHDASMRAAQRLKKAETSDQQDSASSMANKLMRTFTMQMEAMKRHRSAGEQNVIVKHVHVYPGGQAVVGTVKTAGKDQLERAHVRDRDRSRSDAGMSASERTSDLTR